jgi:hypothetical protein
MGRRGGVGDGLQLAQGVCAAQLVIGRGVDIVGSPRVAHRGPGERGQHAHRLDGVLPAAPVHHEQGVFAGAGAVHPVQRTRHPEPGLVEPSHLAGGDGLLDPRQEAVQPPGGAGGERGGRARRQWDAKQLSQRLRGPLLRQELAGIQVHDDRGDPRAILHRRHRPHWPLALGPHPARAFPLNESAASTSYDGWP